MRVLRDWQQHTTGDLVGRTRALFYLCATLSLLLTVVGGLAGTTAGALPGLLLPSAAVYVVTWTYRYRSGRAPLALDVVDAVVLLPFTLACAQPAAAFGITFSALWFRALYGRTGHVIVQLVATCAALVVALPLWPLMHGGAGTDPAPVLGTLLIQLLNGLVARYLAVSLIARGQSQRRDAVLTELGTQLLGATTRAEILEFAHKAIAALCAASPGMRVLVCHDDGTRLRVTAHAGELTEVPATLPRDCLTPQPGCAALIRAAGDDGAWIRLRLPATGTGWLLVGGRREVPADGLVAVRSMVNQVALALRNSETHASLEFQALTDTLTGLANRAAFTAAAEDAAVAGRPGTWVLFIDLDDFKNINDGLGHAAGDQLLQHVADRLVSAVRAGDLAARLGGDEFAVLLHDADADTAATIGRRVVELCSAHVTLDGRVAQVGASVGIAGLGTGGTVTQMMQHADVAMYAAKAAGKNRVRTFHPALLHADDSSTLEAELRTALATGQITVFYQPIVAIEDGQCTAVEALVRWRHPERGLLAPVAFLDVAEHSGLIFTLGEQVLAAAVADAAAFAASGHPVTVHVNASPAELAHPTFVARVASCLSEHALPPSRLVVEITESAALESPEARRALHDLAALGVGIAVDDFGTGYAALTALRDLPVDIVKIDKSFVEGVVTDVADRAVLTAIAEMARQMGLQTVAEGVENAEQQAFVDGVGIRAVQGYLHSRPVPAAQLLAWLGHPSRRPTEAQLAAS